MPRSNPCVVCGFRNRGKAYEPKYGPRFCRTCREAGWGWQRLRALRPRPCSWCLRTYTPTAKSQQFCSTTCAGAGCSAKAKARRSGDADSKAWSHWNRKDRMRKAAGLSQSGRAKLLAKWRRQRRRCIYCDSLATTLDHAIPLYRGGTHYEGNLVPACQSCNSKKNARLIIEYRLGKSIGVTRSAAFKERQAKKRAKPKPEQLIAATCALCGGLHTGGRRYCSNECMWEANARLSRDRYRAKQGLPVDPMRPSKPRKSRLAA